MTDDRWYPDLDPSEAARLRRRDRAAEAKLRELLRPGMGKVFKQITDSWANDTSPGRDRSRKGTPPGHDRPR